MVTVREGEWSQRGMGSGHSEGWGVATVRERECMAGF